MTDVLKRIYINDRVKKNNSYFSYTKKNNSYFSITNGVGYYISIKCVIINSILIFA